MASTASNTKNYKVEITYKQILSICLPIAASILVPQLNFIINNIFLGKLGNESLAIAGITGVYYLIFAVIGSGLNNSLQMLIARRAGENNIADISSIFWQGVRIAIAFACVGVAFTLLVTPHVFSMVLRNKAIASQCTSFLNIRIWGLFFLYVYQMRNALLVGTNNTKFLIYGTAIEALANVAFDYIFIFGKMGMPAMGINGAAIASVVAEILGLIAVFLVIKHKGVSKELNLFAQPSFNYHQAKTIVITSLPLIGQFVLSIAAWEFFYILIEHKGIVALAVSNVMRNVFGFFGCITWAFASTTNSMVSNIIGQGMPNRVMELLKKILTLSVSFACVIALVLNIFPLVFLQLFSSEAEFLLMGTEVIRVVTVALVIMSFSVVFLNAVTGTGNTKINLYIELAGITAYCTYVFLVLKVYNYSIVWGWASEWVYWTTMLIPAFLYIKKGKWHKA